MIKSHRPGHFPVLCRPIRQNSTPASIVRRSGGSREKPYATHSVCTRSCDVSFRRTARTRNNYWISSVGRSFAEAVRPHSNRPIDFDKLIFHRLLGSAWLGVRFVRTNRTRIIIPEETEETQEKKPYQTLNCSPLIGGKYEKI